MIRQAKTEDLREILHIYALARDYMKRTGNPLQWENSYPPQPLTEEDIAQGRLYLYVVEGRIQGVFAYIQGPDPDYARIDGAWPSDDPYYAVHRLASRGEVRGVVAACLQWALEQSPTVRIDTHADNKTMQRALERQGFIHCGTIYIQSLDDDPRMAYQRSITGNR